MSLGLLVTALAASACGAELQVSVDAQSFASAGHQPAAALPVQVRDRFAAAAQQACTQGWLQAQDLASYRELLIQNGEGASEPLLYFDENRGWGTLILQYAYQGGAAPEARQISAAIRCWREPEREECFGG